MINGHLSDDAIIDRRWPNMILNLAALFINVAWSIPGNLNSLKYRTLCT